MAGLSYCCRKLFVFNTPRLINKNGILLQSYRRNHQLIFQISSPLNRNFLLQKRRLFCDGERHPTFRLASTNVDISKETNLRESNHENAPKTDSVQSTEAAQSSSSNIVIDEKSLPEAPFSEPAEAPILEFVSTGLKEASFESLGLGSWWPSGILQTLFEYLHVNVGLPWWQVIIAVTFATKILLLPLNISVRRDTINTINNLPQITMLQEKITEARTSGDHYAAAVLTQEFQTFMMDKKINIFGFMKTALIQTPIFLSVYYAMRGMVNAPVESLKTEGLFWFTDLTVPDPYYILPLCLSSTLFLILEVGAEGNPASANSHAVKWGIRAIPLVILGVTSQFSACMTFYWTVSNIFVLSQTGLYKIPAVSEFLKIPKVIRNEAFRKSRKRVGFIEGFKEGFENAKLTGQLEDRHRVNMVEFQRAGTGAIPRTFKKNPLLQKEKK